MKIVRFGVASNEILSSGWWKSSPHADVSAEDQSDWLDALSAQGSAHRVVHLRLIDCATKTVIEERRESITSAARGHTKRAPAPLRETGSNSAARAWPAPTFAEVASSSVVLQPSAAQTEISGTHTGKAAPKCGLTRGCELRGGFRSSGNCSGELRRRSRERGRCSCELRRWSSERGHCSCELRWWSPELGRRSCALRRWTRGSALARCSGEGRTRYSLRSWFGRRLARSLVELGEVPGG